jgi:hypothetical protein
VRSHGDERTERRRGAHLYGLKAESIAALLLRLKGIRALHDQSGDIHSHFSDRLISMA